MKRWLRRRSPNRSTPSDKPAPQGRSLLFGFAAVVVFVLSVLAGLYLFFPAETLKERIIGEAFSRAGLDVRIGSMALYPVVTLEARNLQMTDDQWPVPLTIDQLELAPAWASLLGGDPGLNLDALLLGGNISSVIKRSGEISLQGTGMQLDLPLTDPVPLQISGRLENVTYSGNTRLNNETATQLALRLSNVQIGGLDALGFAGGTLPLGDIVLDVSGRGRSMQIDSLTANGGALAANGTGTLLIGRTAASSRLNLSLQVTPAANADPSLVSLLELSGQPGADGQFSLRLTGTLARPVIK
jgi:type II secretion system protein N